MTRAEIVHAPKHDKNSDPCLDGQPAFEDVLASGVTSPYDVLDMQTLTLHKSPA